MQINCSKLKFHFSVATSNSTDLDQVFLHHVEKNSKRIWTITGRIEAKDSIQNSKKANLHFFLQCLQQSGNSENHH